MKLLMRRMHEITMKMGEETKTKERLGKWKQQVPICLFLDFKQEEMTEKTIEASRQGLSLSELSIAELDDSDGVLIPKNELRMKVHTFIIYIARRYTLVKFKLTLREKCFISKILLGSSISMVEFVYKCKALHQLVCRQKMLCCYSTLVAWKYLL
ncbi:hypothetical protein P8452_20988 [Trifolium repens]|nr:hypothetical protein P8452_20988 [Trifolium repens]